MKNRFDLEQQILQCWCVVDDIITIAESPEINSKEKAQEALQALANIYQIKFNQMFNTFEEVIKSS